MRGSHRPSIQRQIDRNRKARRVVKVVWDVGFEAARMDYKGNEFTPDSRAELYR
jgi:hypothetical protein